jgi:hypothetical protein
LPGVLTLWERDVIFSALTRASEVLQKVEMRSSGRDLIRLLSALWFNSV